MPFKILVNEPYELSELNSETELELQVQQDGSLAPEEHSCEYSWKLGEERPYPNGHPYWLEATGKELQYIRNNFENVPIKTGVNVTKCTWHGEMAAFIFSNL